MFNKILYSENKEFLTINNNFDTGRQDFFKISNVPKNISCAFITTRDYLFHENK